MAGVISVGELRAILTLSDQFSGPMDKVGKTLGITSESFSAMAQFAGLAVGAIGAATAAIVALGTRGADVADVQSAFDNLATAAGASAEVMLGKLQEGTLGTIANFDLMKVANKALGAGLVKSSEDMGTLAQGAQLLADRTGKDTKEAFESLFQAIASGRTKGLAQLGLFVDTKVATEDFARSLGKTTAELTSEEKAQGLSVATLQALREQLAAGGASTADFGDQIARGKVLVQNFTDSLGVAIATSPVVQAGMKGIADGIQGAFGGNQQETVKALTGYVNSFAIFLLDTARVGVKTAEFITNAFLGAKAIFNLVLETLFEGVGKVAGMLATLAEKAKELPIVGDAFKGMAGEMRSAADTANSLAYSFGEMKNQALDSAANTEAGFGRALAIIDKTREGMVAAQGAVAAHTETVATFAAVSEDAATRSVAATTAIVESTVAGGQAMVLTWNDVGAKILETVAATNGAIGTSSAATTAQMISDANAAGFQTRDQLQQTEDTARKLYEDMLKSGMFTYEQLQAAHAAFKKAEDTLNKESAMSTMQIFESVAASAVTILHGLFGHSKTAAIAAAIIDTAAAVVKTLAHYPWPFSLVPAAAALAAGLAQVSVIRSQSFRFGTGDGGALQNFGPGTAAELHGEEAVVTRRQGESIAGMVEDAIARGGRSAGDGPVAVFNLSLLPGAEVLDRLILKRVRGGFLTLEPS